MSPSNLLIKVPQGCGSFAIHSQAGIPIVTIYYDGRVELNPAFTVDEGARAFWDAVIQLNPHYGRKTP